MIDQFFVNSLYCPEKGDVTITTQHHRKVLTNIGFDDYSDDSFRKAVATIITLEYLYKYPVFKYPFLNSYVHHTQSDLLADKHLQYLLTHTTAFDVCHQYKTDKPISKAVKNYVDKLIAIVERNGYTLPKQLQQKAYDWFNSQQQLLNHLLIGRGFNPRQQLSTLWIEIDEKLDYGKKLRVTQIEQFSVKVNCCIYDGYIDVVDFVKLT